MSAMRRSPPHAPLPVLVTVWTALIAALFREVTGDTSILMLASYNLTVFEPVLASTVVAIAAVLNRGLPRMHWISYCVLGFFAIIMLSLLRGFARDAFEALFVMRAMAPVAAFLLLGVLVSGRNYNLIKAKRAIVTCALIASGLIILRANLGADLFYTSSYETVKEIFDGGRAASAGGAILVGAGLIFTLSDCIRDWTPRYLHVGNAARLAILSLALIVTQQATAILATFAALAVLVALAPGRSKDLRFAGGGLAVIALTPAILMGERFIGLLPDWMVGTTVRRQGTLEWRQSIWEQVMLDYGGWSFGDKLFGLPAGEKPTIVLKGWGVWENSVHSQYFGTLIYAGSVGLALYLAALLGLSAICTITAIRQRGNPGRNSPAIGASLCIMMLVFGYSYELRPEHGVLLCLAMAVAASGVPGWGYRPYRRSTRTSPFSGHAPSRWLGASTRAARD